VSPRLVTLLGAACLLAVGAPWARAAEPLGLAEVLESVRRTHPELAEARAKVEAKQAKVLGAEGAFDLDIAASAEAYPLGDKPYGLLDVGLVQPTQLYGLALYGGWRVTAGTIPDYKDQFVQKPLKAPAGFFKGTPYAEGFGEARLGAALPLWRGGVTDKRRTKLATTRADVTEQEAELAVKALALELKAAEAYWKWVAAGRSLEVAVELRDRAKLRDDQTRTLVTRGALAPMELMETERALLKREGKVVESRGKLEAAAVKLSLFLRTLDEDDPKPRRPGADRLPPGWYAITPPADDELMTWVARALEMRPEPAALEARERAARARRALAQNDTAPQVDLGGALAAKPDKLTEPTLALTLEFSQPVQRREALGKLGEAEAELAQIAQAKRGTRDVIEGDARMALASLKAAYEAAELAKRELELADALVEAEQTKFFEGDSEALKLNLREEKRAEAAQRVVDTQQALMLAWSAWRIALGASPTDSDVTDATETQ
jgi:outer membrane protein TolC